MGFFDRFTTKKPEPAATSASAREPAASVASSPTTTAGAPAAATGVKPRLAAAREKLEAKDLPGALAIYEELLATAGDRPDVLVTISGDLGTHGHVAEIIELIAPRYDAERHGPATGLNLLQAYLAVRNADAAQHVLDILFALNRPELEERLFGFSNAIAEILASPTAGIAAPGPGAPPDAAKIGLITISKPIWFYGLEALATQLLPPKEGRLRRIAFAQLAQPGQTEKGGAAQGVKQPEDELGRLARAIPLWLHETFYFSAFYAPSAALGVQSTPEAGSQFVTFGAEWTLENLRQLVETTEGGLDYIVTGGLRNTAGDYELVLRVWEVKGFRERKVFTARWTPATVDEALSQLHSQLRGYMEWSPAKAAFAYTSATQPRTWLETLGASLGLFLTEKSILPPDLLRPVEEELKQAAAGAAASEVASLAFLTAQARAAKLGLPAAVEATLAPSPLVGEAKKALA